jgi:hypothetical protein
MQMPLWLTCQNVDPLGDPLTIMFKVGDDLRQDQLVVQMFRIMDKLWLNAGLDLKMSPYVVLDAGHETGMIEVVQHSATNAAIQKQYGGMKAAFSEKPLAEWLRKHNPKGIALPLVAAFKYGYLTCSPARRFGLHRRHQGLCTLVCRLLCCYICSRYRGSAQRQRHVH